MLLLLLVLISKWEDVMADVRISSASSKWMVLFSRGSHHAIVLRNIWSETQDMYFIVEAVSVLYQRFRNSR